MNKYTIQCTEEQTKKARKLGAPIEVQEYISSTIPLPKDWFPICNHCFHIPTVEQMIGWLEEQEEISDLHIFKPMSRWTFELYASNGDGKNNQPLFNTRREATFAAIDAALEYLTDNKK